MKRTILAMAVIITLFSVVSGQGKAPDGEANSGEDMEIIILFYANCAPMIHMLLSQTP